MKKLKLMLIGGLILSSTVFGATHRDGTYRGFYSDQVEVEFKLEDDIVTTAKFRGLSYKGVNYNKSNDKAVIELKEQYEALIDHLVGKNVDETIDELYYPEDIELAGATVRSTKVRSAVKDALNRGAYNIKK